MWSYLISLSVLIYLLIQYIKNIFAFNLHIPKHLFQVQENTFPILQTAYIYALFITKLYSYVLWTKKIKSSNVFKCGLKYMEGKIYLNALHKIKKKSFFFLNGPKYIVRKYIYIKSILKHNFVNIFVSLAVVLYHVLVFKLLISEISGVGTHFVMLQYAGSLSRRVQN